MSSGTETQLITADGIEKLKNNNIHYELSYRIVPDDHDRAAKYCVVVKTPGGKFSDGEKIPKGDYILSPKIMPDYGTGEKLYSFGEALRRFHLKYCPEETLGKPMVLPTDNSPAR